MASAFEIRRVSIDTSSWTAVTTPIDCTAVDIQQTDDTNAIKVRTNTADSATEKTIPVGKSLSLPSNTGSHAVSWPAGSVVCYMQAAAGTGPAVIEFLR